MPRPLPTIKIPPSKKTQAKLSYAQLRALWIGAGGAKALASTMAAVALAETSGDPTDPWKVGHKSAAASAKAAVGRVATDGSPEFWPAYQTGAWTPFYTPVTPDEKTHAAAVAAGTKAGSPEYQGAKVDETVASAIARANNPQYLDALQTLAMAKVPGQIAVDAERASLRLQQHFADPWVVQNLDKNGRVVSFGYDTGTAPPAGSKTAAPFLVHGEPITKSQLSDLWTSRYNGTFVDFTGKAATPADIVRIVDSGVTPYALQEQLAAQPTFTSSPVYKANAAGLQASAKEILGKAAPASTIRKALAENWDSATFQAHLRASPAYAQGPEYKTNLAQMRNTYRAIYGAIPPAEEAKIEAHTAAGWSPAEFGQVLRAQPSYKQSPEYRQNAGALLGELGAKLPPPPSPTPVEAYQHGEGQPVPPPPSQSLEYALHQAGLTTGETRQLHQIWSTSINADGSLDTQRASQLAQPIKQRLLGTAYTAANKPEIQQASGSYGEGLLAAPQLQTLGEQETGHTTPAGIKLQSAYEKAVERLHSSFRSVSTSPAVANLFQKPGSDVAA